MPIILACPWRSLQAVGSRTILLDPVNDPPVVTDKRFEILEDGTVVGVLEAYDPEGENITFRTGCSPERGAVEIDGSSTIATTTFTYSHAGGGGGWDSFVFVVSDGEKEGYGQASHSRDRCPMLQRDRPRVSSIRKGFLTRNCLCVCVSPQGTAKITAKDTAPVARNLTMIAYSGRDVTFNLPAYDPEGGPLEIYILSEPQGAADSLSLTREQSVSIGGLRRKVEILLNLARFILFSHTKQDFDIYPKA